MRRFSCQFIRFSLVFFTLLMKDCSCLSSQKTTHCFCICVRVTVSGKLASASTVKTTVQFPLDQTNYFNEMFPWSIACNLRVNVPSWPEEKSFSSLMWLTIFKCCCIVWILSLLCRQPIYECINLQHIWHMYLLKLLKISTLQNRTYKTHTVLGNKWLHVIWIPWNRIPKILGIRLY